MASGQSQAGTGTTKRQMKVKYNKISLNDLEFEKGDKVKLVHSTCVFASSYKAVDSVVMGHQSS